LFLSVQGFAQVEARMSLDTNWMLVGEQTTLRVNVQYTPADSVESITWPQIEDTLVKDIEILEKSPIDTAIQEGEDESFVFTEHREFLITAFDSGYYAIPPLTFDVDGKQIQTNALLLEVHLTEMSDQAQMKDIKNVVSPPWTFWDWLKTNLVVIILVVVGLVLIITFFLAGGVEGIKKLLSGKKEKSEPVAPPAPPRPADEIALEALDKLKENRYWQQGLTKQFYISLSDIVREYLENQFGIHALEETSRDILIKMRHTGLDKEPMQLLRQILLQSDLVKFAKENPTPQEHEQILDQAYRFVKATTPVLEDEQKGGNR
jgi:hypothetical protein